MTGKSSQLIRRQSNKIMVWRLFTYYIPHDRGYAPNPYFGVCTLNTCKPQIRREAEIGDWLVALKKDRVICAMKVTRKMTMKEYWHFCRENLPGKIPPQSPLCADKRQLYGDCQYDFSATKPVLLKGMHDKSQFDKDLKGEYGLVSDEFIYFGSYEKRLPPELHPIAQDSSGNWLGRPRKSTANDIYRVSFINWYRSLRHENKAILGKPSDDPLK